jgi:hypothetical protein
VGNGSARTKEDGRHYPEELRHDEKDMFSASCWSALPDLLLTLIPTAILVSSATETGRG